MKEILRKYKAASSAEIDSYCIPILVKGEVRGRLRPITFDTVQNDAEIGMLSAWRHASGTWFTTQFPPTEEGTKRWLQHQVVDAEDRILFFVEDESHTPVGQVGLIHYDENKKECEFDNLLRGRKGQFGNIMIYALIAIGEWSIRVLSIENGFINVLADNVRAIHIYQRLGANEVKRVPLVKQTEGHAIRWVPAGDSFSGTAEREMTQMVITRQAFMNLFFAHRQGEGEG